MKKDFDDDNYSDLEEGFPGDLDFSHDDVASSDEGFPEEEILPIDDPLSDLI